MMQDWHIALTNRLGLKGCIQVADPCYFLPKDLWQDLVIHHIDKFKDGFVLVYKGSPILIVQTAYGDGEYRIEENDSRFFVDSGTMCVASVNALKMVGFDVVENSLAAFTVLDNLTFVESKTGRFEGDGFTVDTEDQKWIDDEYEEEYLYICDICGGSFEDVELDDNCHCEDCAENLREELEDEQSEISRYRDDLL